MGTVDTGAPALPGAGRPVVKATIRDGDGLSISRLFSDGTTNLGKGRAVVEKIGRERIIKLAQDDGSEIRILVIHE